jgi:transposase
MAQPLVSDALWELVEPLIPKVPRRYRFPGRNRIDDRRVLTGILFVWGCGSGCTRCCSPASTRRSGSTGCGAAIDSSHVRAVGGRQGRPEPGRPRTRRLQAPPDRLRQGDAARRLPHRRQPQRHHAAAAARGRGPARARAARAASPSSAQDLRRPRLPLPRGAPRAQAAGIAAKIAWPKSGHGSGLGRECWVVERTIAWLHQYRRLRIRFERRADIHEAFLHIACSVCLKQLEAGESFC